MTAVRLFFPFWRVGGGGQQEQSREGRRKAGPVGLVRLLHARYLGTFGAQGEAKKGALTKRGHRDFNAGMWRMKQWVLVLAVAAAPWLAGLSFPFLYDDIGMIAENPFLEDPANVWTVLSGRTLADPHVVNGRRPVVLTYFLDRAWHGLQPAGWRVTNLASFGLRGAVHGAGAAADGPLHGRGGGGYSACIRWCRRWFTRRASARICCVCWGCWRCTDG